MSSTNPYTQKPNTRKSVKYFVNRGQRRDLYASSYPRMFIEDVHLGIMPIGGRSENPDFAVKVEPLSEEVEELIRLGLPTHHGEPRNITEAVCDFMDEAVHALSYYGKAYYEIVYFYTDENRHKIEGFAVERIPNETVRGKFGFYWQLIPKKALEPGDKDARRFIRLPREDLLILSFPRELGGIMRLRKMLSQLQWLSKCTIPEFAMKDMNTQERTKGYDFAVYRENHERFLAKLTQHLGWMARQSFSERSLEFYQIYRLLKFEKTKAILREYILHKLNESLGIIGKEMKFSAQIRLEDIPSPKDYDNYMRQLIDGSLQFSKALKLMRF